MIALGNFQTVLNDMASCRRQTATRTACHLRHDDLSSPRVRQPRPLWGMG